MAVRRPQSLRMELLFQLGFLASSAVLLTGLATALIARFGIEESIGALVVLWVGSSAVFVLFAHHLVRRMLFHLVLMADSTGAGSVRLVPVPERSVTNC